LVGVVGSDKVAGKTHLFTLTCLVAASKEMTECKPGIHES